MDISELAGDVKALFAAVERSIRDRRRMKYRIDALEAALDNPCTTCDGVGVVTNPDSATWWDEHNPHGVSLKLDYCSCGSPVPQEEYQCAECDGVGRIPTEAGKVLMEFVARYRR